LNEDPRKKMEGDDLRLPQTQLIGQIMCRFKQGGQKRIWSGTGTIIKKLNSKRYVIITCSHNFEIHDMDGAVVG